MFTSSFPARLHGAFPFVTQAAHRPEAKRRTDAPEPGVENGEAPE